MEEFKPKVAISKTSDLDSSISPNLVSIETEIPEVLYEGMKNFIVSNPNIDQYGILSSALANFLYQNGCSDRAVTEKYLDDLFTLPNVLSN